LPPDTWYLGSRESAVWMAAAADSHDVSENKEHASHKGADSIATPIPLKPSTRHLRDKAIIATMGAAAVMARRRVSAAVAATPAARTRGTRETNHAPLRPRRTGTVGTPVMASPGKSLMSIMISRWKIPHPMIVMEGHTAARPWEKPATAMPPSPTAIAMMSAHTKFLTPVLGVEVREHSRPQDPQPQRSAIHKTDECEVSRVQPLERPLHHVRLDVASRQWSVRLGLDRVDAAHKVVVVVDKHGASSHHDS